MKWKKVKLKDMAGINGVFKDGDWVESKDQDPNGDVRLIQMADIGERVYKDKSQRFMTSESFDKLNCTEIIKGDILISRMPDPIGRACIFEGDDKKCATVVDICIIRVDQEIVNSRWLMHRINFIDIRTQIEMKATGTTRKRIARSKLGELEIPLPPMDIQIKIAEALDKAQELIDNRKEQLAKYDELLQSVFLDMFGDPVTNPRGWDKVKIEDITSKVGSGGTPRGGQSVYDLQGNLFLRSQNIRMNKLNTESAYYINDAIHEKMKRSWVYKNDVLLNITGASIGRVAFYNLDEVANVNQHVCIIRPIEKKINGLYLSYHFSEKNYNNKILGEQSGGTREAFNFRQIKTFDIIVPPLNLQNKFADIVEKVESEKKRGEESLKQLKDNFNSIMQKAFKGELF